LFVIATSPPDAVAQSRYSGAGVGNIRLSFLSRPKSETQQPAEQTPRSIPAEDNRNFDGVDVYERRMSLYGVATCEDRRREDHRQRRQRAGRSGRHVTFGRGRKRHDPYRGRTVVRK
jgi:hypothetical protein